MARSGISTLPEEVDGNADNAASAKTLRRFGATLKLNLTSRRVTSTGAFLRVPSLFSIFFVVRLPGEEDELVSDSSCKPGEKSRGIREFLSPHRSVSPTGEKEKGREKEISGMCWDITARYHLFLLLGKIVFENFSLPLCPFSLSRRSFVRIFQRPRNPAVPQERERERAP